MALRATTKAGYAGGRLRRLVARRWRRHGEQVPRLPPCARPISAGHPRPSPDTKARRSGGTRKDRCAVCTKVTKGMALRATTKAALPGVVCDDLGRDHGGGMVNKLTACRQVPAPSLRDIPSRRRTRKPAVPAGHEKTAARSARKSRREWRYAQPRKPACRG